MNRASFFGAIIKGNLDKVKQGIDSGKDIDEVHYDDGVMALHYAIEYGQVEFMELLLSTSPKINIRNHTGHTPLHYAAYYGRTSIVEMLLSTERCIIDPRNDKGLTPLHLVSEMELLFNQDGLIAVDAIVNMLLDAGANPLAKTEDGKTPFELIPPDDGFYRLDAWWRLRDSQFDVISDQHNQDLE